MCIIDLSLLHVIRDSEPRIPQHQGKETSVCETCACVIPHIVSIIIVNVWGGGGGGGGYMCFVKL